MSRKVAHEQWWKVSKLSMYESTHPSSVTKSMQNQSVKDWPSAISDEWCPKSM